MSKLEIVQFPCLDDNYGYLVHASGTGETATIDTPDAAVIAGQLDARGWGLTHILNTHWHPDHAGGNAALQARYGAAVIAPADSQHRIPNADRIVTEGDVVALGGVRAKVLAVPGHTTDHIAYWFRSEGVAFVGDALFAIGCGRLFEGSAEMMWTSLSKLKALPPETMIYCAHEYTAGNAAFAITIEPENAALAARVDEVGRLRAQGLPTVPSRLGVELETNPFLRPDAPSIRERLGMTGDSDVAVFAEIRARKDNFRG